MYCDARRRKYVEAKNVAPSQPALPHRQTPESPTHRRPVFRAMFHGQTYAAFTACTLEAYSVIQHHAEGCLPRQQRTPDSAQPFLFFSLVQCWHFYRSLVGKLFLPSRCLCSGHTTAKAEVWKKAECRFVLFFAALKYDSSVYLPDFIFQFVQKFQPALLLFARSSRRIF